MMNYFSNRKKWMAYLILLTFVFTCIVPTNLAGGNSAWADTVTDNSKQIYEDQINNKQPVVVTSDDGMVKVKKYLKATEDENYFDITLEVEAIEQSKQEQQDADAAVVLVLDVSGSMKVDINGQGYCFTCSKSPEIKDYVNGYNSSCSHWPKIWAVSSNNYAEDKQSRFWRMSESLGASGGFLDAFKGNGNASRMVSVVYFGQTAKTAPVITTNNDWVDLNNGGLNMAKNAVSFSTITGTTGVNSNGYPVVNGQMSDKYTGEILSQTAQGEGLAVANNLLQKTLKNKNGETINNKYVVLLTDGRPEGGTNNENGLSGTTQADFIKKDLGAQLFVVGFGTDNLFMVGGNTKVNDWLKSLASDENKFIPINKGDSLSSAFSKITETINSTTKVNLQNVVDPMGEGVEFVGFIGDSTGATVSSNTVNWDVSQVKVTPSVTGNTKTHAYSLKYRVRLKNELGSFNVDSAVPTNGEAFVRYKVSEKGQTGAVKTLKFPVPSVKGYLGELPILKIDARTKQPLAGAKFTLNHNATTCNGCKALTNKPVISFGEPKETGTDGKVKFERIPSGHSYTLTESKVPDGYGVTKNSYAIDVRYGDVYVDIDGDGNKDKLTDALLIANTPNEKDIVVTKTWSDNDDQDGFRLDDVTLKLYSNGEEVTTEPVVDKVTDINNWTYTWSDLPIKENGEDIVYTVKEFNGNKEIQHEGWYDDNYQTTYNQGTLTVMNTHTPETIKLQINKAWSSDENIAGRRNPVTFTITGKVDDNVVNTWTAEVNETGNWQTVVENLPRYSEGKFITYTVSEDVPEGYTISWDTNTVEAEKVNKDETASVTATNTLKRTGIRFEKDYVGGDFDTTVPDDTQAAKFFLTAEQSAGGGKIEVQRISKSNVYATTAGALQYGVLYKLSEELPDNSNYAGIADRYLMLKANDAGGLEVIECDENGIPLQNDGNKTVYLVQENGIINKGLADLGKLYNYPKDATLKIFGSKSWVGGTTDSAITLELFCNGVTTGKTTETSLAFDWKYAFNEEFPRYDEKGKPYIYTIVEHLIDGFTPYYGNTTDQDGNLVMDIVNVKDELSIDPYGDIWVKKDTNKDDTTTEYGFELWIQALKDESSQLNQEQQRDKTLLATAISSAKKDMEDAASNVETKIFMFENSAFATSGSQYKFFVTETDNRTARLAVTTGSAIEAVNMWVNPYAIHEGNWFETAVKTIKQLINDMAEAFVSGLEPGRPNTETMLNRIKTDVVVTSGSAMAFSEDGLTGMFDAIAAHKQAQKDLKDAQDAFARFEASLATPSSLILTVNGNILPELNPNSGANTGNGLVMFATGDSKVSTVYYKEDGKYYVVPFTLTKGETINFNLKATTGSAIKYIVTETDNQGATSTSLTSHFPGNVILTAENTLSTGDWRDLTSGSAVGFEFFNKYSTGGGGDTTTSTPEPKPTPEKPEENIPDENVPTGSVEPGEPLDELDDPEIPLGDAPATGDTNNAVPFMALLLAAVAGLVITRRKFN